MKSKKTAEYVYPLKIEASLIKRLKDLAKKNRRTIRGEMSIALENHINSNNASK